MSNLSIAIRPATIADLDLIYQFLVQKAAFDGCSEPLPFSLNQLQQALFGDAPLAEVLLAEVDQTAVGFALFYQTYSSFLAQPTLWLDDLFIQAPLRHQGVGTALIDRLLQIAQQRGCGRIEWTVNRHNDPAIAFYQKQGATISEELRLCRLVMASAN